MAMSSPPPISSPVKAEENYGCPVRRRRTAGSFTKIVRDDLMLVVHSQLSVVSGSRCVLTTDDGQHATDAIEYYSIAAIYTSMPETHPIFRA